MDTKKKKGEKMNINEMMKKYHLTRKQMSDKFGIPYRTIQNWSSEGTEKRKCPDYVLEMMENILEKESSSLYSFNHISSFEIRRRNEKRKRKNKDYNKPVAMKLHIEVPLRRFWGEELDVLKKYANVEKTISRDIIVPGDMTLHTLHFVIMNAFGFQNSHLHKFSLRDYDFEQLTNNKFEMWYKLVGILFRSESCHTDSVYWDDDYYNKGCNEIMSVKEWIQSKYLYPTDFNHSYDEHLLTSKLLTEEFLKRFPDTLYKSANTWDWDVTCEFGGNELIESLPIRSLLVPEKNYPVLNGLYSLLSLIFEGNTLFEKNRTKIKQLYDKDREYLYKMKEFSGNAKEKEDLLEEWDKVTKEMIELLRVTDLEPNPFLSSLAYTYDYGDNWTFDITCTEAWYYDYHEETKYKNLSLITSTCKSPSEEDYETLAKVVKKGKPVCVGLDGLNMIENAGGTGGLKRFYETINEGTSEEKKSGKKWAREVGWTDRIPNPDRLL